VVYERALVSGLAARLGRSCCRQGRQADEGIIAHRRDGFQRHVARTLDRPFIVLFEEDGADEPDQRSLVREDADDLGSALDLAIEALSSGLVEWSLTRCSRGKSM